MSSPDLDKFFPLVEVRFPEGKTASNQIQVVVNGQPVKIVNGSEEEPEITQTGLGLLQRAKDNVKALEPAVKMLVKLVADSIRAGVPISKGVRDAILNEKERENPAYKAAYERHTSKFDQKTFQEITERWGETEFLKVTSSKKWGADEGEVGKAREEFIQARKGQPWPKIATDAFLREASPKAKGNWQTLARMADLLNDTSTSSWDEIEVKVAK
jgi:hypothetical protein